MSCWHPANVANTMETACVFATPAFHNLNKNTIRLPSTLVPPTSYTLLETHQRGKEAAEDINTPLFLPQYVRGQRYFSYAVTGWLLGYIVLYVNELSLHFRPAKRHAKSKYIKRAQKKRTLILQCAVHVYEYTIESSTPACARVRERACLRTCVEWSCSCVARAFYNCYIYIFIYVPVATFFILC